MKTHTAFAPFRAAAVGVLELAAFCGSAPAREGSDTVYPNGVEGSLVGQSQTKMKAVFPL